ncbi:MAG: phosphotransferase [Candidatus Methanoperedens sp.]|nr:phosphotransferase [Candidatus Methanoperedens sp.]MCZ7360024.1 phosphotransferase [Candidatus Methanoperedens sp.]HLB70210.1 phosphotransferase [Candidatus Methanoperedens sp.]
MMLQKQNVENYLSELYSDARVTGISELGGIPVEVEEGIKGFGYGKPYLIEFESDGKKHSVVLSTMRVQKGFGHDHFSDRAAILIWQNSVFNRLPGHVRSIDAGYFTHEGELFSAGKAEEYFILMEKVEGKEYFLDLERIKKDGKLNPLDKERAAALSSYLAKIHASKHEDRELYLRKIRDTVGHGECIMGLTDSYPDDLDFVSLEELCEIEKKCVGWRYRIRGRTHRLCMTHGDFHPWNIMFREGADFTVLDRSRGEWGEAADDVSSITMNYIFYSLQKYGELAGAFKEMYEIFFDNYLERTGDRELLEVIQPFYVFRSLVVASPIWYPNLDPGVRKKLFNFIHNVLDSEVFDYQDVNSYI